MAAQKQVFQTEKPGRWKRFVWGFHIFLVIAVLCLVALIFSVLRSPNIHMPVLSTRHAIFQRLSKDEIKASLPDSEKTVFQKTLKEIRQNEKHNFYQNKLLPASVVRKYFPVRAGFYVNWDNQSFYSLRNNIGKMNMVLPEWLFVGDKSDTIATDIDVKALNVMRKHRVAIVPMLSNYFNQKWNGRNVHRIIISKEKRTKFIQSLLRTLAKYQFQGVNVDFEELTEKTDEHLIQFQKELYQALNQKGYLITQDIVPFNPDYNYKELAQYNDFLFLMGYDQHNASSMPGPIAEQAWIEKAMDDVCNKVSAEKVVLCIAAYGYDWQVGYQGEDVTYQEAINRAIANNSNIDFDNNSYNLRYSYSDGNNQKHEVCFTDAATSFNAIRASEDFGTAGVAVWYLGAEDTRLWQFYDKSLQDDSLNLHPFDFSKLRNIQSPYNVDFIGEGEILDIVSSPTPGKVKIEVAADDKLISEETYETLPTSFVIKRSGDATKKIALTFDDGPNDEYTPKILKILRDNNVHATFFVTGVNAEANIPLLKRVYDEGHEIGNHTFSHPNLEEVSASRIRLELSLTRILLESMLGHSTILFRPPYNTDSDPENIYQILPLATACNEHYISVGLSIDPNDWEKGVSADTIVARTIKQEENGSVLLLHDAGGIRTETVKALPRIIEFFKKKGYTFVTISQLLGKTRDDVMPPVKGEMRHYAEMADSALFEFTFFYQHFLYGVFFVALILVLGRILSIAVLAIRNRYKIKHSPRSISAGNPSVSIIVPAYNEEVNVVRTIENLLKCDYPNVEIVFVDDGSKDRTFQLVKDAFDNNPKVTVLTKPNGGKASALNFGIEHAQGEFLVCIDADTLLKPDAVSMLMPYFGDSQVAAVAGNVKVGNKVNLLTNWQSIEYTTSQNFDRLAFDYVNSIMVVPGAIGAFRKSAMLEVGAFTTDTLAEDCDLTLRFLRAGYRVRTCNDAISMTEAPESTRMFLKQRFRWSFGIMQSFWKHRDLLFNTRKPNLGWIVLPNVLIYQLILPLFSPIVDILTIFALFSKTAPEVIVAYFGFFAVDCVISFVAYSFDGQKFTPKIAAYMFIQRIIYRQLLFFVLIKSYLKAIKGELAHWGVLKRTGNVKQE
ncbi:MAG: glycosyltransferase [Bacteroidota bacterium]|nr:glycosyltransferase [Bacteroidota bacterium]